jgi:hypothetical protein
VIEDVLAVVLLILVFVVPWLIALLLTLFTWKGINVVRGFVASRQAASAG